MHNLEIEFEWQDPGGAKGEELRATWASLSISIDEKLVTEVLDSRTKSVRSRVFLPLFPLAEWIADNWWFLQTETEGRDSPRSMDFDRRHNLRWAREGFALPSVRFVTLGDNVAVQWAPLDIPDAAIRFLSSGSEVLPTRTFIAELHEFVDAVITRLDESGVTRTTLHEQWTAIENADAAERKFCRAAARLGADPYAIDDQLQQAILDVAASIRHDLLDDFLSLANPGILKNQAAAMKSASESIEADADRVDALRSMRDRKPALNADGNPWEMGYRFAAQLRQTLNGGEWKSRSLDELAGHLSIDQLDHCLLPLPETNKRQLFEALAGANKCNSPKFLIEKKRQDSRQFAFCRSLFEHLTSPQGRFALVSGLRTERQQMNRAFAAEFLAPHTMLKGDLSAATVGEEEIEDLATDYGVSPFVIRHQIGNHRLAEILL